MALYTATQTRDLTPSTTPGPFTAAGNSVNLNTVTVSEGLLVVTVSVFTGTSITFGIDYLDSAGNLIAAQVTPLTAITTTGTYYLPFGKSAASNPKMLPPNVRVSWTVSAVTACTAVVRVYGR
jgi:hypothetical protein